MKRFAITVLCGLLLAAGFAANAAEPVRIYLANDDHTDFMWTADADTYANVFVEMLDFHLKLADETATNAPPYRNRFNADGNYWLWNYEQKKTPAEFARLIERIKDGTLSAPLNALVSCYGGQPAEAVLRGMYYAGRLERQHGVRLRLAVAMENQTLPLGLASLFAGSGARYSWRGVCGCASRFDNRALGERAQEIYWWTGPDDQRLLLKWHSLAPAGNQHSGGYAEAFDPVAAVRFLDSDAGFLSRYRARGATEPYHVRAAFGFGWDALDRKTGQPYLADPEKYPLTDHFHRIAQRLSTPERQVIVSNEQDFFEDFETTHGASLDRVAVTYGNEWDLYSASMSETSARVKRAVEKLRSAEMLAALVSLEYPLFMTNHRAARDRAFIALGLYWEHNWTADGPISRPQRAAWQEQLVREIESFVNAVQDDAVRRLGGMIQRPAEANRFLVLNPLGWARTDAADLPYPGPADIHVRDLTTGRDVPHQFLTLNGSSQLRILASDVPPAGYKVFEIVSGQGTAPTNEAATVHGDDGSIIENDALRLVIERDGAIRSFTDKQRGHTELAATLGGLKLNDFAADSDAGEPLRVEHRGPVSVTLLARSQAGLPHTTAITLYRGSDRVDIRNELHANFSDVRHWAFSFALDQPSVRTEEVGAVILNQLQSAGGDYADTHARYDYLTVNHFADITDGSGTKGMTVSNPDLAFARLGHSTATHLDTTTPQLHLLAGGQVDGPNLGIRGQNGNTGFLQRFALRPHGGYHPAAAMKFALEHQNPFVTGAVVGSGSGAYPETTHSLIEVSNPDVLLWALKPHEDGIERGLVVRLWNLSDQPAEADITFAGGISVAQRITHLETDVEAVPLTAAGTLPATFTRQQIQTYRTAAEPMVFPSEWPTRVELDINETRSSSRNGGAAHQFKLLSISHRTMPYRRNAADGTIIYAATVEMEVDGVPVTLTARPYQFPTVVGGLRMLIENTKTWSESGTVAATAHAKDLSFTFTHVGEPWGPADVRFPIGSFRWHATTYHNTWMGLVPQNDQVYYHRGEDFGAQPNLLPLLAPRAGSVTALPSVGLRDATDAVYEFYHMFEDHIYVTVGQRVDAGFTLAHTGGHGNGNADQHLHVTITAPDGSTRNTYPMMAEAYLRDYPDSGIANAGGYQFMLPGQTLTLDASRSLARPGRTITGYRWILHEGTEVTGPTANLTIFTAGYFTQELRVTYDDGSEQRDFTPVRVFRADGAGQAGMLGFIYQYPVRGIQPGTLVTLMHNPWMVGVSSRTIDFGDGSPPEVVAGNQPAMTHAYAAPGLYTVTVSVGTSQVLKTSVLVEGTVAAHVSL